LAEISPEEKFAVSHRGAAFRKLLDFLSTFK
jgi:inosine/xanthosine triphosphate pyrophosphatase family protein